MTDQTTEAPAASANGQAPVPGPEQPCEDCASTSERVMGFIGVVLAIGLLAIGVDLLSGGALSRLASGLLDREPAGAQG